MKIKIGLTYDMRSSYIEEGYSEEETAEFDREETISAIEEKLCEIGFLTDRIGNAKQLVKQLSAGNRWDLVFNIAEGMYGFGREALVPALLDAYKIPYTFSDPMVLSATLHKGITKHVVRDLGVPTPDFAVVNTESDIQKIDLSFPLFAKPVAEGTGKGITAASKITNKNDLQSVCLALLNKYDQPVLIERFLPGREFTAGILGTGKDAKVIGVIDVTLKDLAEQDVYSFHNKENYEGLVEYHLVDGEIEKKIKEIALTVWNGFGCRDAGRIDLREDEKGIPNFIEINPLAGIRPIHSDLCIICDLVGISYREMIKVIVNSAMKRIRK